MRIRRLTTVLLMFGLVAPGCCWSPPSAPPAPADKCTPADEPTADTVTNSINGLPPLQQGAWREVSRGHAYNCRLYWVQLSGGTEPTAPQHLLFFDRNT